MKLAIYSLCVATAHASSYQQWSPQPVSYLSSTAVEFGVQSVCAGQYMGSDCSEKVCAYGLSSNASPYLSEKPFGGDNLFSPSASSATDRYNGDYRSLTATGVHSYTECSGQGICDRTTGLCSCFDGYTGKGCRRTVCPNDCSGHGMCKRNIDANPEYSTPNAKYHYFATQYWDGEKTMRCACDRGYEGADCSLRICPHGDDVLTTCAADSNFDVQVISFTDTANNDFATDNATIHYTLEFEDHFGGTYKTRPIALSILDNANAHQVQEALEELPNKAVPTVQVSSTTTATGHIVSVSFTDSATTGLQNTLQAEIVTTAEFCPEGGQTPYIMNEAAYDTMTVSVAHQELADSESSYEENVPCGNRGICDSSVGKCDCFEGHTGEACEIQSVFV